MIEYLEARNANLEVIGIIDTAQSVIWHSVYYGVGDFQIFVNISDALPILAETHYITRPDNDNVGIIEAILIADDPEGGKMVTISGRFAKSLLDRRIIYNLSGTSNKAAVLSGRVETTVRKLVSDNAIASRSLEVLALGEETGITKEILTDNGNDAQKQVSFDNLLEYTEAVLKEYGLSAKVKLGEGNLLYTIYEGTDRSTDGGNEPIVFSREFDNLLSSEMSYDSTKEKNVALIGGEGEGIDRFCVLLGSESGLLRKEVFVNASSIKKTYKDENDVEKTYTDEQYTAMLKSQGHQVLSEMVAVEDFNGSLDVTNGNWKYGRDFFLGDIVTLQDNDLGIYRNVRIGEITEYQDQDGYSVEAVYQGE